MNVNACVSFCLIARSCLGFTDVLSGDGLLIVREKFCGRLLWSRVPVPSQGPAGGGCTHSLIPDSLA